MVRRNISRHDQARTIHVAGAPKPIEFAGWPGPQFDPSRPDDFSRYIKRPRQWMLRLMERQFGRRP